MPAFANEEVFVSDDKRSGFRVGIDALYLRPTNSDLFYVTKLSPISFIAPVVPSLEENFAVEPGYHWGFYAYVGYAFPCTANDLTLAYTYLHSHRAGKRHDHLFAICGGKDRQRRKKECRGLGRSTAYHPQFIGQCQF